VVKSVTPGQMVVKIVQTNRRHAGSDVSSNDSRGAPVAIMMVGLQGPGKPKHPRAPRSAYGPGDKRRCGTASSNLPPEAMEQLAVLGRDLDIRR